jgi:CxxC-x17-CxxC domain-containing protein
MGRFFNDRNSNRRDERPMMHSATCDKCGKRCEVPFKPSGSKPIYCSNCFEKDSGGSSNRRGRNDRRDFKENFSAVCDKCGKNCEVPFKPSSDKPIYCSKCFEGVDPKRRENNSGCSCDMPPIKEELDLIKTKLDEIMELVQPKKKVKKAVSKKK